MILARVLIVCLAIALLIYGIILLLCRIRRRLCQPVVHEEDEDAIREPLIPEDIAIGQTLKRPNKGRFVDLQPGTAQHQTRISPDIGSAGSHLVLEVISGPSAGVRISQESPEGTGITLTVGRVQQNDLVLNDPEVSGKHALITWNPRGLKWEIVDMGSLNGTLVNYKSVSSQRPNSLRQRGEPVGLVNGDIVTLGSTSQVMVRITSGKNDSHFMVSSIPFGVGVMSDPMALRRGGKLPMEDVYLCEWPLFGVQQFGVFCIFDGHGGAGAAEAASKIMPRKLSDLLVVDEKRKRLLSECDAAEVLKDAFLQTEQAMDHEYEGCTASVLLVWMDKHRDYYAQCANVGDSTCIISVEGKQIIMTEDHRLTSTVERHRLLEMGKQLKDGETRICGMNIARALGDKFLKEQECCFSADPYVSKPVQIARDSDGLVIMGSDGLWDVLSPKRALQLALEGRDGCPAVDRRRLVSLNAEQIAQLLVKNAGLLRTKDNTTVIVLDFSSRSKSNFFTL